MKVQDIAKDTAGSASGINQTAIDATLNQDNQAGKDQGAVIRDRAGTVFNPEIHATDQAGKPVVTRKGIFRHRSGPKKVTPSPGPGPATDEKQFDHENAGRFAADLTVMAGVKLCGPGWIPVSDPKKGINEYEDIRKAYSGYLQAQGVKDIPPGWVLTFVLFSYAAPRLNQEETKNTIAKALTGIKNIFIRIKNKF